MADSSDVDAALVSRLAGDAALAALMQSGAFVFIDEAPTGSSRFVIVSLVDEFDVAQFGGRSHEDNLFLVEARMLSTAGGAIKTAAARIDALLEQATFSIPGFSLMTCHRERRVRSTEVDDLDSSIRWFRRGGNYRVVCSL